MKWLLITWLIAADKLPALPISTKMYETKPQCEVQRKAIVAAGLGAVCRELKVVKVATLEVVK